MMKFMKVLKHLLLPLSNLNNATFPYLADEIEISVLINESLERPEISFEDDSPIANESSRTATVTANLSHASTEIVSVQFSTSDGTATSSGANADFVALTNQPFTFAPGETSKTISITINQDSLSEGYETFNLTLSQANNVSFAESASSLSATITILDDDVPTLSFKTTEFNAPEGIGNFPVEVLLSETPSNPVTFRVGTGSETANFVADYNWPSKRNYSISTTDPVTILLPIVQDQWYEGNETFELKLVNLTAAVFENGETTLSQTITIIDDEPIIAFVAAEDQQQTVSEGDSTGNLRFELTGPTTADVTVTFETRTQSGSGKAVAGNDFIVPTSDSNTVTIPKGQSEGLIPITIIDDNEVETNETFTVILTSATNAIITAAPCKSKSICNN